jgi:hypothetical protein
MRILRFVCFVHSTSALYDNSEVPEGIFFCLMSISKHCSARSIACADVVQGTRVKICFYLHIDHPCPHPPSVQTKAESKLNFH